MTKKAIIEYTLTKYLFCIGLHRLLFLPICAYTHISFYLSLKLLLYKIEFMVLSFQDCVRVMEFYPKEQLATAWPITAVSDPTVTRRRGPDI